MSYGVCFQAGSPVCGDLANGSIQNLTDHETASGQVLLTGDEADHRIQIQRANAFSSAYPGDTIANDDMSQLCMHLPGAGLEWMLSASLYTIIE